MPEDSAAYVVVIVTVVTFIVGSILLTVVDPVIQSLFSSTLWSANTEAGKNLLKWLARAAAFFSTAILIALVVEVWIVTRQPT